MMEWIPCEKRMPENDGEYLVSVKDGKCDYDIASAYWDENNKWHYIMEFGYEYEFDDDVEVIAWMPMIKPYKETPVTKNVLYLCNGKKECGNAANLFCGVCNRNPHESQCFLTVDPNFAKNGPIIDDVDLVNRFFYAYDTYYVEKEIKNENI